MEAPARERGDGGIVGDEDEGRPALAPEPHEGVEDRGARGAVEVPRRLVGEEERGARPERPGERDPLLLAARQLRGVVVAPLAEPDGGEELRRPRAGSGVTGQLEREEDVLPRGQVREELVRLEYETDLPPTEKGELVLGHPVDRLPFEEDLPPRRAVQPGHEAEEGRLPAAGGAEDGGELAGGDRKVDGVEDSEHPPAGRKLLRDAAKLEKRRSHGTESRIPLDSVAVRRPVSFSLAASALALLVLSACGPAREEGSAAARELVPTNPGAAPRDMGDGRSPDPGGAPAPGGVAVPADAPLVVFLGDSLTAGYGVEPGLSYPDWLQKRLDAEGLAYRVVNQGISGDTTSGGVARLDEALRLKPVAVVLALGANDGLRGLPVEATRANLAEMIDRLQAGGAKVLLGGMTLPRNYGPDYVRGFESVFKELAREKKTGLIPFLLEGVATEPSLMQADALHPTAEGNRRVAENVFKHLRPMLR